MHLQHNIVNWTVGLTPGVPQVVLAIDRGDLLVTSKQINPQAITILRHWGDNLQKIPVDWDEAIRMAEDWWPTFIDATFREQYAASTDYVKGHNEMYANSQSPEEQAQVVMMDHALAVVWNNDYRTQSDYAHIRPVLGSAAVGNDMPGSLASVCVSEDAALSYHAYMYFDHRSRPDWEFENLSGRWIGMDESYDDKPTWCFTEGGPFESAVTGWMAPECLNADLSMYVAAMRTQIHEIQSSAAYQEGRVLGPPVWFTSSGGGGQFASYETSARELTQLAYMHTETWANPPDPINPIPVDHQRILWQASVAEQSACGIRLNSEAALQLAIFEDGLIPVHSEFLMEVENSAPYVCQAGERPDGFRQLYVWLDGKVVKVEEPE